MKKLIGAVALVFALVPYAQAQETPVEKAPATQASSEQLPPTIGDGVRQAGKKVKKTAKKVRRVIVTRCADGRHTVKGQAECASHGGVSRLN